MKKGRARHEMFFGDEREPGDEHHEGPVATKAKKKGKRHGKTIEQEKLLFEVSKWLIARRYKMLLGMIEDIKEELDEITSRSLFLDKCLDPAVKNGFREVMVGIAMDNFAPHDIDLYLPDKIARLRATARKK